MKLQTRRASDPHGIELIVAGGDIEEERACGMAAGTRIEVRELFFNTPARLKFMKTVATEQGAIAEVVQKLALANHSIAFSLARRRTPECFPFRARPRRWSGYARHSARKLAVAAAAILARAPGARRQWARHDEPGIVRDGAHDFHFRQRTRGARQAARRAR